MGFVVVSVFADYSVGLRYAVRGTVRLCFLDVGGLLFGWMGQCFVLIPGHPPCPLP